MATAALLAARWPFQNKSLQQRLIKVGVSTLEACVLAGKLQQPRGGGAALQTSVMETHAAFVSVEDEFGFCISGRNKLHNALVLMVNSFSRSGVTAEFDGGPGVESVHARGKLFYDASSHKGEVQDIAARASSAQTFVTTDLARALPDALQAG